jgi:hypothetical protein
MAGVEPVAAAAAGVDQAIGGGVSIDRGVAEEHVEMGLPGLAGEDDRVVVGEVRVLAGHAEVAVRVRAVVGNRGRLRQIVQ